MADPRDELKAEIDLIHVGKDQERAFLELAYTASERGLIPFDIGGDDVARDLIALVKVAFTYRDGVPDRLRM